MNSCCYTYVYFVSCYWTFLQGVVGVDVLNVLRLDKDCFSERDESVIEYSAAFFQVMPQACTLEEIVFFCQKKTKMNSFAFKRWGGREIFSVLGSYG
jgi:hypothetical protein